MKHKAIYNLYPNVRTIDEDDNNNFFAKDENGNEISIDMSAVEAKATELQAEVEAEKQTKVDAKVSGNQKLLDLGLTQAEATALTGYTPPTEA
jgi:3-hydroxyisobutyrate dehydrogenase-like beta-hydroxyacid dehydrogenase